MLDKSRNNYEIKFEVKKKDIHILDTFHLLGKCTMEIQPGVTNIRKRYESLGYTVKAIWISELKQE